jgi:AAA+ ATPase superfamily predicted ATPase
MENITGKAVTHTNYLKTRLYLVDELKKLTKNHSVIIEAPRRFGKTSVIKELMRQQNEAAEDKRESNVIFFELEGEDSIESFCFKFFRELLNFYHIRKHSDMICQFLGDAWNAITSRIGKFGILGCEIELREETRGLNFGQWKEKISPLISGLNSFERNTIIIFDEFPDMLANFRHAGISQEEFTTTVDLLTGWLRTLRQSSDSIKKYQFVFCGSVNLRKTLEKLGISKRINDLESLSVPPITRDEAKVLIDALSEEYKISIDPEGLQFLIEKTAAGSPYYGQILIKALRDTRQPSFTISTARAVYEGMLRSGNHDLNHFHSRLEEYLTPVEREIASNILLHLCRETCQEQEMYQTLFHEKCDYEMFQDVIDRLIFEGYLTRDLSKNNQLRFVSPLLKDWWACKKTGCFDACL